MASPALASAQSPPPKCPVVSVTRRDPHCWSKLPLDLMQAVFERLGFLDFERAKAVCSSWQSGSRQSKPNNKIPWMVLFPLDKNYCLLFNPEDKEKLYKTQHLGDDFAKSFCLATCGSWILMQPHYREIEYIPRLKYNLYILDLITRERINIPAVESETGLIYPMLWIDEKTKDHLVIGKVNLDTPHPICFKKGDNSWKQFPQLSFPLDEMSECFNMVYKDHKLYCLNYSKFYIFYFSGEIPQQVFRISVREFVFNPMCFRMRICSDWKYTVVVTVRGDVLIVRSIRYSGKDTWDFRVYKMDSSKGNKWEEIVCLGDESIFLDLGITVLAKDLEGITSNSIYFTANDFLFEYEANEIFIFNLDTKNVEQLHQFVSSSIPFSHARWFLPNFKR